MLDGFKKVVSRNDCSECDGTETFIEWSDKSRHCFKCGYHPGMKKEESKFPYMINADYRDISDRKIKAETCKFYNYKTGTYLELPHKVAHEGAQFTPSYKNGIIVGHHIRYTVNGQKQFKFEGNTDSLELFGQHIWGKGKKLVVTEGQLDMMSVSQIQDNAWPTVSLPNGAASAAKAIRQNLRYFNNFEEIILMFDMDEPGQKAALECAKILPIGKVSIAALPSPYKDANEMLMAGKVDELRKCIWNATPYKPNCIIKGDELLHEILEFNMTKDADYPFPFLNSMTFGLRKGEIVLFTSGVGMGKSSVSKEIIYSLLQQKKKVAFITLEQKAPFSGLSLLGLHLNERLHLSNLDNKKPALTEAFNLLLKDYYVGVKHSGAFATKEFIYLLRYLVVAEGCEYIVIDPITNVPLPESGEDERVAIDKLMLQLRELIDEDGLEFGVILISHTKRLQGNKGHEDGVGVSLSHLRGSRQLEGIPDVVIALNGDTSDPSNTRTLTLLKNRPASDLGNADILTYDKTTGRIKVNTVFNMKDEVKI